MMLFHYLDKLLFALCEYIRSPLQVTPQLKSTHTHARTYNTLLPTHIQEHNNNTVIISNQLSHFLYTDTHL